MAIRKKPKKKEEVQEEPKVVAPVPKIGIHAILAELQKEVKELKARVSKLEDPHQD